MVDLACGPLAALDALVKHGASLAVNLGTGQGYSVLDMVRSFEKASGRPVPYEVLARRPGDVASCYADPATAKLLGWQAELGIKCMCADHWWWREKNPREFETASLFAGISQTSGALVAPHRFRLYGSNEPNDNPSPLADGGCATLAVQRLTADLQPRPPAPTDS